MSGTGEYSTVTEIAAWMAATGMFSLSYSYDSAIEESPSPTIKHWAASQQKLVDFFSDVCAFFNHMYYINNGVLDVIDMTKSNGTRTLTEYDYFAAPTYSYAPPTSILKATWETREAVEETIGKYVKASPQEAEITSDYSYGEEKTVKPFHDDRTEIKTRLTAILASLHKSKVRVQIPITDDLPVPGEQMIFSDSSFKVDLGIAMNCRSLRYDFKADTVEIEGDGVIA